MLVLNPLRMRASTSATAAATPLTTVTGMRSRRCCSMPVIPAQPRQITSAPRSTARTACRDERKACGNASAGLRWLAKDPDRDYPANGDWSCWQTVPGRGSAPVTKYASSIASTQLLGLVNAEWPYPFTVSSRALARSWDMATAFA